MNLTIPTRNDPIARVAVLCLLALALWASVAQVQPKADAQGIIILDATPSPALPTPALAVEVAPVLSPPTAAPLPAPEWPVTPPDGPTAPEAPAGGDYIANVGAQADHCVRGCAVVYPPSYDTGPIVYADQGVIIDPNAAPDEPAIAVAVPAISAEQAAIIGLRQSNGCADGELFYPREGCHLPGSGGPMPGAVGE